MGARDDYPNLAAVAKGSNSGHVLVPVALAALNEIDSLRAQVESARATAVLLEAELTNVAGEPWISVERKT